VGAKKAMRIRKVTFEPATANPCVLVLSLRLLIFATAQGSAGPFKKMNTAFNHLEDRYIERNSSCCTISPIKGTQSRSLMPSPTGRDGQCGFSQCVDSARVDAWVIYDFQPDYNVLATEENSN
jgi:hypothetical protein